jgi:endonuclease-3
MPDDLAALKAKYARISALLRETYGYPKWRQHLPPVDEMVNTILSQNTSDTNRDMAFGRLTERFDSWEAVRDADLNDVIDAIRPAGLANQKGPSIQRALHHLTETQGKITLDFITDMPVDEAKKQLTSIKGIGPKTAAIILLFAFNKPAFPVDTHVHRVSRRLGLIGKKTSREKAHDELEKIVPPEDFYPFHLNMIRHGREICNARNPRCGFCPLQNECNYFQNLPADEK